MDTEAIMRLALELAGQSEVPADSGIVVPAREVRRAWFGIDVESADLIAAKAAGYDLIITHHPVGPEECPAVTGSAAVEERDFPDCIRACACRRGRRLLLPQAPRA